MMTNTRPSVSDKRRRFHALHEQGCFVVPNPWDLGSARMLQSLGFQALASTSSGFAWSQARPDNHVSRDMALAHLRELVAATDLPVNADFESGFGEQPGDVRDSVRMAVRTGVAGLSIEDATGDAAQPLFSLDEACERLRAARRAIDEEGGDTLLVGRAEGLWVCNAELQDVITRLKAYAQAGADCLYAPGLRQADHIAAVVEAVAPKPVNLLIGGATGMTVAQAAALGVRRISVGGALARAAWGGFLRAARELATSGAFDALTDAASGQELDAFFKADLAQRRA